MGVGLQSVRCPVEEQTILNKEKYPKGRDILDADGTKSPVSAISAAKED